MLDALNQIGQVQGRSALQENADKDRSLKSELDPRNIGSVTKEFLAVDPSKAVLPVKKLEQALNNVAKDFIGEQARLAIDVDSGTGRTVFKSIDRKTGDVLVQYPSEEFLRQLASFFEANPQLSGGAPAEGLAVDQKA